MPEESSTFRALLKNEITWVIFIVVGVMGFVQTVVLPIKELQISAAQIQKELANTNQVNKDLDARVTKNANDIIELRGEIER